MIASLHVLVIHMSCLSVYVCLYLCLCPCLCLCSKTWNPRGLPYRSHLMDRPHMPAGNVELVSLDGPFVTLRLTGRFWHRRTTVMSCVAGTHARARAPSLPLSLFLV